MSLEPFDIPMFYGRIAIAAAALTHALFATFIVGSSLIGAACETIGYVAGRPRFERLSRHIAFTLIFTTAGVSFLGVTLVFTLNIFWPHFWSTLFRIMFWPLLLEASFFLAEAVFAYAWYYSWDWAAATPARKRLHLSFGWIAAGSSVIAMVMIDIVASYMLTPRPPDDTWGKIFNPTMVYLDIHRLIGNLTWTGFGLAGLWAIGFWRATNPDDRSFFRWAGAVCFGIGFGTLLIMPAIGYQYLLKVRYSEPQAFYTLMLGPRSWLFDLVALLYSALIVIGSCYIVRALKPVLSLGGIGRVVLPISVAIVAVAGLVFSMPYHLQHVPLVSRVTDVAVNPLGAMQPNKYFAIALLVVFGLLNWVWFLRSFSGPVLWWQAREERAPDRTKPRLLLALSVCAMLMMLTMGWVRETARAWNGYLIYGVMKLTDETGLYQPENTSHQQNIEPVN
jgi:cytochrome d ubiquinol oxidase subunit I